MKRFALLANLLLLSIAAFSVLILISISVTHAQSTLTWNGGGGTSNWSDSGNWGGVGIPSGANNNLIFSATPSQTNSVNDIAGLTIQSISVPTGVGSFPNYVISGNGFVLGDPTGPSSTYDNDSLGDSVTLDDNITLGRNQNWGFNTSSITPQNTFNGTIDNNGFTLTYASNSVLTFNGVVSGTGGFVMTNVAAFPVTFGAINTYTGLTTDGGGILSVPGALAGDVFMNPMTDLNPSFSFSAFSATLNLSGTINGNLTSAANTGSATSTTNSSGAINGNVLLNSSTNQNIFNSTNSTVGATFTVNGLNSILAPTHNITIGGDVTFNSGTYNWDLSAEKAQGTGTAGSDWSLITLTGNNKLTFSGSSIINLGFSGTSGNPSTQDGFWDGATNHQWLIGDLNTGALDFSGLSISDPTWNFGSFSLINIGNDLYLNFQAIPEPSAWAMLVGGLGVLGLVFRRSKLHAERGA